MASFTDSVPQFNPYVQQLPVEAMVQVGMQKQKQYDEGIQKIQTNIDNIAGLAVGRDVDKAYLQSKLNQLGNNLKTVAAGDFSNFQLVNSVNGMTNQIIADPVVQTAVSSAATRKKELEFMEDARKKGELTPQNQAYFSKRDSAWVNSTDLKQGYNARYNPYFDWKKHVKETFDALKIDDLTSDQIFELDANGNPVVDRKTGQPVLSQYMTRLKQEGYKPERLQAAISEIFSDPRVSNQLSIDGEYIYRGVPPEGMIQMATQQANQLKNSLEDQLDELNIQLQLSPGDIDIQDAINKRELAISNLGESLQSQAQQIVDNPDGARSSLFATKARQDYTTMFNFSKTSKEIMDSPAFNMQFKLQQEANQQSRWAQTEERQRWEFKQNYDQRERFKNLDNQTELLKIKAKQDGSDGSSLSSDLNQDNESQDFNDIMYHQNQVQDAAMSMENNQSELIWQSTFASTSKNVELLNQEMKKQFNGEPITRQQAIKNILTRTAKSKGQSYDNYISSLTNRIQSTYNTPEARTKLGKQNPALYDQLNAYEESNKNFKLQNSIDEDVKSSSSNSFFTKMSNIPYEDKVIKIGDKSYTLTKQNVIDLAIVGKYQAKDVRARIVETPESKAFYIAYQAAESRLNREGKGEVLQNWKKSFTPSKVKRASLDKELEKDKIAGRGPRKGFMTPYYMTDTAFRDIYKFYDAVENETFKDETEQIAANIRRIRQIVPNVSGSFTTGDDKSDKVLLEELKSVANIYSKNKNAIGKNADDVIEVIKEFKNFQELRSGNIIKGVEKDASGTPTPFIQIGNDKLYLNDAEGKKFGISPSNIYNDELVNATATLINKNNGTSTYGPIDDKLTYRTESTPLDTNDFPKLAGTNYVAKVSFKQLKGKYYPYIYINNGKIDKVVPIQASSDNLGKLMREVLPSYVSPATLEQLLIQY